MEQGWRVYVMKNAWLWYLLIVPMELPAIHVWACWKMERQFEDFDWMFCITIWMHVFLSLLLFRYYLDMTREAKNALLAHEETADLA